MVIKCPALRVTVVSVAAVFIVALTAMPVSAASLDDAREMVAAGKYAEAAEMLTGNVQAAPDQLAARFWLGRARLEMGDLEGGVGAGERGSEAIVSRVALLAGRVRQRQGSSRRGRT